MAVRPIDGNVLIEWFRPYLHTGEAIPADVVIEDIRSMPTLTPPNEWVSVEGKLPELPKEKYCWVCVLGCRKSSKRCMPMFYERTVVRGKTVERWKDYWDRIVDEPPDYWMPLPAPPYRRAPEGEEATDCRRGFEGGYHNESALCETV